MSDVYLPIVRDSDSNDFFVMLGPEKKQLSGQIMIYKQNEQGYEPLGSSSQNREYENEFKPDTYFVKKEDQNLLFGGNKTKRRQYRYRSSSKKRIASRRRGRGRQTKYSRRK
jgi:hypothetical protein